ncbi:hypothetical protein [Methanothrix harundinacea]|uniref:hypothetical protein n=1 Tax=Methanothrix harundinacea TaxID=301375 RepID=UPI000ADE57A0|nr:hypothetical protein [Methanothrix harundinacea]
MELLDGVFESNGATAALMDNIYVLMGRKDLSASFGPPPKEFRPVAIEGRRKAKTEKI